MRPLPQYATIPELTMFAIKAHVTEGRTLHGFAKHLIENKLCEAVRYADAANLAALPATCLYLVNELPADAWGSPQKVLDWQRKVRYDREQKGES